MSTNYFTLCNNISTHGVAGNISKIPSVCQHLFPESTFVSRPCLCHVVGGRLVELVSGHLRPSSVEALVYGGCPCQDPPVCHRVQSDSVAKRQPFCVLLGVVTSCVLCACVRGRVSRSCATENTYTPARLEALFKADSRLHSQSFVSFAPKFLRVVGAFSNSSSCSTSHPTFVACCLQCSNPPLFT